MAALADAVRQPRRPATSSGRSFRRSLPPLAGPGPPSSGPLGLNSSPNLRIKMACPAAPDVLPAQMPHHTWTHGKHTLHRDMVGAHPTSRPAAARPSPQDPSR
jgi:hypothetical protein